MSLLKRLQAPSKLGPYRGLVLLCAATFWSVVGVTFLAESESLATKATGPSALDTPALNPKSLQTKHYMAQLPSAIEQARAGVSLSRTKGHHLTLVEHDTELFTQANDYIERGQLTSADDLLKAYLDAPNPEVTAAQRATFMRARVFERSNQHHRAIELLESLPATTPIEDYRQWMLAQNHDAVGQPMRAYEAYKRVSVMMASPMVHRARVRKAHMLFKAQEWSRAARELDGVNRLYPDYPRRPKALYEQAKSQEKSGDTARALRLYHQAWFEFPYHHMGELALEDVERIESSTALRAPVPTRAQRYQRWRRLRINKHWDHARALFLELERDIMRDDEPDMKMVHEIWTQLALNAFIPKRYEECLGYLQRLKAAYESGQRAGINRDLTYRYLATTWAKFGRLDTSLKMLEKAWPASQRTTILSAKATFLKEHGKYSRALAIYDVLYQGKPGLKKSWDYTWLLYKSGRVSAARDNFEALVARSSGRTKQKYQYWLARSQERAGQVTAARQTYAALSKDSKTGYYGIQARNRLWDLDARKNQVSSEFTVAANRVAQTADVALDAFEISSGYSAETSGIDASEYFALNVLDERAQPKHWSPAFGSFDATEHVLAPTLCAPSRWGAQDEPFEPLVCDIAANWTKAPTVQTTHTPALGLSEPQQQPDVMAKQVARGTSDTAALTPKVADDAAAGLERVKLASKDHGKRRAGFATMGRFYWEGHDDVALSFSRYDAGRAIGPHPEVVNAYGDTSHVGGIERAVAAYGKVFGQLERAKWLHDLGMHKQARWAVRDVAMEYRALKRLGAPRTRPHQLKAKRMTPLIDNRRQEKATWGYVEDQWRWPVPKNTRSASYKAMLKRQQQIIRQKEVMRPVIIDALKDVGDYYMVRRLTLDRGMRGVKGRMQAYPRAFPEKVIPEARKRGVNPYLVWALMTVESSYNPDSVSVAEALGLLQVIPRTGLKTAQLLGEKDFGHYDLLDEDVAIRHGVFYFSQLVRKFKGQEFFAIAGYNGGPHRVAEWIDMRGDMPLDEFVEEIPYDQARAYTKKVTRFLFKYLSLYEGVETLYVGQNVNRDWRVMPNF